MPLDICVGAAYIATTRSGERITRDSKMTALLAITGSGLIALGALFSVLPDLNSQIAGIILVGGGMFLCCLSVLNDTYGR